MNSKSNNPISYRIHRTALGLLLVFFFFGCSQSHILHTQKRTSRDYTYVDFIRNPAPYEFTTLVGGEHVKALKILGFEGDKFLLEFDNKQGRVNFNIDSTGCEFKRLTPTSGSILIRDLDAIVTIETWAHPSAEYSLKITPLKYNGKKKGISLFFWKNSTRSYTFFYKYTYPR